MADDAVRLLDQLGIEAAHVVGASLGGMIAQTLAIRHPERVLSLTSIMSTTGDRSVGQPHPGGAGRSSSTRRRTSRDGMRRMGGPELEDHRLAGLRARQRGDSRARAGASFERGYNPHGLARQLAAIVASGDRTAALASWTLPTLVIHGEADPLIDVSGGRATAAAIPGREARPDRGHGPRPSARSCGRASSRRSRRTPVSPGARRRTLRQRRATPDASHFRHI